ncbi:ankyrin repeat domain-containing protein [Tenacibaculum sp. IB213877]|uniref:ankyrin repeat domain-containing protein n=1 Tax=Tenacibaculum sp. IB213877 TaxID=3097351 RepID=UPI002A5A8282|nr:ankyrin repeat domain-containing protein [Tenacibaculum sp. IB213877]MDY0780448.1 ankyrin repeat domain-containing protein [Tenacibaculum sp. IB213877]
MKKVVLSILLVFAVSFSISATNFEHKTADVALTYTEVSPFCKLIQSGNYDAVKAMIDNGEDVNKKSGGLTPLMFAARYNRAKIAQLLIDKGAKLKTKSDNGHTALKWAELAKAYDALTVIKEALDS